VAATACGECGFDPSTVSVNDAVVTLRSMPRRWRAALALVDEDEADVLTRRPADGSPSAMEHAEDALRGLGGAPGGGDVVDAIAAAAEQRAAEAERVDAEQWREPGRLAALHDAVHAAVHHLRAATKALAAARQRR
jgi:hypothetical protein